MIDSRESWKRLWASSSPAKRARLDAFANVAQLQEGDQVPDVIVAGHWPVQTIGAVRLNCADCNIYVALSPDSGMQAKAKWPTVPVVCLTCAEKRARESVSE